MAFDARIRAQTSNATIASDPWAADLSLLADSDALKERQAKKMTFKILRDQHKAEDARRREFIADQEVKRKRNEAARLMQFVKSVDSEITEMVAGGNDAEITHQADHLIQEAEDEIADWKDRVLEQEEMLQAVHERNLEMRAEVDSLRRKQAGMDGEVWDVIAPDKRAKLFNFVTETTKKTVDTQIVRIGESKIDSVQKQRAELATESTHYQSVLVREVRDVNALAEQNNNLRSEVVRLRKAVSDKLEEKRLLDEWERNHNQRIQEITERWESQLNNEVAAAVDQTRQEHEATLVTEMMKGWQRQQTALLEEHNTLQNRLETHMKAALALQMEVANIKKEMTRIRAMSPERQEAQVRAASMLARSSSTINATENMKRRIDEARSPKREVRVKTADRIVHVNAVYSENRTARIKQQKKATAAALVEVSVRSQEERAAQRTAAGGGMLIEKPLPRTRSSSSMGASRTGAGGGDGGAPRSKSTTPSQSKTGGPDTAAGTPQRSSSRGSMGKGSPYRTNSSSSMKRTSSRGSMKGQQPVTGGASNNNNNSSNTTTTTTTNNSSKSAATGGARANTTSKATTHNSGSKTSGSSKTQAQAVSRTDSIRQDSKQGSDRQLDRFNSTGTTRYPARQSSTGVDSMGSQSPAPSRSAEGNARGGGGAAVGGGGGARGSASVEVDVDAKTVNSSSDSLFEY